MLFITHRLQAYFLKITSGRWLLFPSMHCCKRAWKLPYTRLRRSSSIAATSSTMACFEFLNSHDKPTEHTVFQEPQQERSGTVSSGDREGHAMSSKREITVPNISRTTYCFVRSGLLRHPAENEGPWGQCQAVVTDVQQSLPT
jgi:hypothetical protein